MPPKKKSRSQLNCMKSNVLSFPSKVRSLFAPTSRALLLFAFILPLPISLASACIHVVSLSLCSFFFKKLLPTTSANIGINKIENLFGLDRLTKLQLDNNNIEAIINLSHLKNLQWLDLSFNKITQIEGLDELTKLTDLSLYQNKITRLDNMDKLVHLNCFSVGNNELGRLDNILYLRRFGNLRMVTLTGNPVCKDPEYRSYVLAHLKHLKYLDYRLVDPAQVLSAREQYQEELLDLEDSEKKNDEEADQKSKTDEEKSKLASANLSGVPTLFDDMLRDDPEANTIHAFMYIQREPLEKLRALFVELVDEFKVFMFSQHKKRVKEREDFEYVVAQLKTESEEVGKKMVKEFEQQKKRVLTRLRDRVDEDDDDSGSGSSAAEQMFNKLRDENENLCERLLEQEMELVEQFEEIIGEYGRVAGELAAQSLDQIATVFSKIRDEDRGMREQFLQAVAKELERLATALATGDGDPPSDIPERARQMLEEKEPTMNSIGASGEFRDSRIDGKEEELVQREKTLLKEATLVAGEREHSRNRGRVAEIWAYIARNRQEFEELALEEDFH